MFCTYFAKVFKKVRLQANAVELAGQELALDGLVLVFGDFVGVLEVNLLYQLPDQVLVEVRSKPLAQLSHAIIIILTTSP